MARFFSRDGFLEVFPATFKAVPTPVDLFVEPLALSKVIINGREAFDAGLGVRQFMEKVRGQKAAFGSDGDE